MKIHIWHDGKECGPYSREEIFALLKEGAITNETPARREEDSEWQPVREILSGGSAGLFSVEQIVNAQAAAPLPVIIPDFLPSPRESSEKNPSKKSRLPLVWAAVFLLLCAGGFLLFRGAGRELPEAPPSAAQAEPLAVGPTVSPVPSQGAVFPAVPAQPGVANAAESTPPTSPPLPANFLQPSKVAAAPGAGPPAEPAESISQAAPPSSPPKSASSSPLPDSQNPPAKMASSPSQVASRPGTAKDFFKIGAVKFLRKEPRDGVGAWSVVTDPVSKRKYHENFLPCLEVPVSAEESIRSERTFARAYFFDQDNTIIGKQSRASPSGLKAEKAHYGMPVLFPKGKSVRLFFEIPGTIRDRKWKAVVVFGDKHEAVMACYPSTESDFLLDYPEKKLVHDRPAGGVERKPAMDPLVEHKVKTWNPKMPQFTLFLRPPKGVDDAGEIQGVLTLCVLANNIEAVRRELQREEMSGDYGGILGFANKNKLAIIAWASQRLWNPNVNFEDLPKDAARNADRSFDLVANAWERGVEELSEKYGLPKSGYLLWGGCGAAQWAHRLCMRKPDYFLAIYIHIPGSFDKPTAEARKVLWCLTTGELYGGYERSNKFVKECRAMGYPIVYKAIVGLDHAGHPDATRLGLKFFEFAMSVKELRAKYDADAKNVLIAAKKAEEFQPWLNLFQDPPFYGDMINQEIYAAEQRDMIPAGFRIALPTEEIAAMWQKAGHE